MDIVVIKPSEFYRRKGGSSERELETKYNQLFQQYNCFSDNAVVIIQANPVPQRHGHGHGSRKAVSASSAGAQQHKREPKTVRRYIMGILNVINADNYSKLMLKAKMYITRENLKEIFQEILEKCASQIFYLHVYSMLIRDLMASLSDAERDIALETIDGFANRFANEYGYILSVPKTNDSYHDFCMVQKQKMTIAARNQMILEFMTKTDFVKAIEAREYVRKIEREFFEQIYKNVDTADVLLQCMLEAARRGFRGEFDLASLSKIETGQKIRFMIRDLIDMCIQ